jgi:hypothetical protein
VLVSEKNYIEAIECYNIAFENDPKNSFVWNGKGKIDNLIYLFFSKNRFLTYKN